MKFSTRDLLLVTVIVALAEGWWVDRTRSRENWRLCDTTGNMAITGFVSSTESSRPTLQHPPRIRPKIKQPHLIAHDPLL